MGGELGDTGAHRQLDRLLPDGNTDLVQPLTDSLSCSDSTVEIRVRQHDQEFFPSVTRDVIFIAHRLAQDLCNGFEGLVSGKVAVCVVELFEPVDIRHEDGERPFRPARAAYFALQRLLQVPAVRDPGELVGH